MRSWCGRSESNRHSLWERHFECRASTSSATPACRLRVELRLGCLPRARQSFESDASHACAANAALMQHGRKSPICINGFPGILIPPCGGSNPRAPAALRRYKILESRSAIRSHLPRHGHRGRTIFGLIQPAEARYSQVLHSLHSRGTNGPASRTLHPRTQRQRRPFRVRRHCNPQVPPRAL
jgi:hypothetical protein